MNSRYKCLPMQYLKLSWVNPVSSIWCKSRGFISTQFLRTFTCCRSCTELIVLLLPTEKQVRWSWQWGTNYLCHFRRKDNTKLTIEFVASTQSTKNNTHLILLSIREDKLAPTQSGGSSSIRIRCKTASAWSSKSSRLIIIVTVVTTNCQRD